MALGVLFVIPFTQWFVELNEFHETHTIEEIMENEGNDEWA